MSECDYSCSGWRMLSVCPICAESYLCPSSYPQHCYCSVYLAVIFSCAQATLIYPQISLAPQDCSDACAQPEHSISLTVPGSPLRGEKYILCPYLTQKSFPAVYFLVPLFVLQLISFCQSNVVEPQSSWQPAWLEPRVLKPWRWLTVTNFCPMSCLQGTDFAKAPCSEPLSEMDCLCCIQETAPPHPGLCWTIFPVTQEAELLSVSILSLTWNVIIQCHGYQQEEKLTVRELRVPSAPLCNSDVTKNHRLRIIES